MDDNPAPLALADLRAMLAAEGITHVYSSAGPRPLAEWRPYPGAVPPLRVALEGDMLVEVPDPITPRPARLLGRWRLYRGEPAKDKRRTARHWLA